MNDQCPYIFKCMEPYCWDAFGEWRDCERYKMGTPRTRNNSPYLHNTRI